MRICLNDCSRFLKKQAILGRQLTAETLKDIRHAIKTIPTGEQRYLRRLFAQLCLYLQQRCDWGYSRVTE